MATIKDLRDTLNLLGAGHDNSEVVIDVTIGDKLNLFLRDNRVVIEGVAATDLRLAAKEEKNDKKSSKNRKVR